MVQQMLHKFGMSDCKGTRTPALKNVVSDSSKKLPNEGEFAKMEYVPYKELIGALLHLANTTRPDIAFITGYLSRFMQDPRRVHWNAAKYVLRYLKETKELGITFMRGKDRDAGLHGFSDSDFAGDRLDRKSTSGHVFKFAGGAVSWRSKKQNVTAQSTVEAEYIATSFAVREALWLKRLLFDLGYTSNATVLYGDNQGALGLAKNDVISERTKHIDVKFHFIKEHIKNGNIKNVYIPTTEMVADIMTKALEVKKHRTFIKAMGMSPGLH